MWLVTQRKAWYDATDPLVRLSVESVIVGMCQVRSEARTKPMVGNRHRSTYVTIRGILYLKAGKAQELEIP